MSAGPDGAEPVRRIDERRRVGVALGSGSARGLAHIGVMRALVDAGYRATKQALQDAAALLWPT